MALQEQGEDAAKGLWIAEEQTGGRGRQRRDWWSGPRGANLALSLGYRNPQLAPELFGLLGAVALAKTLERWLPRCRIAIKWPNDVLVNGAKVSGFLCEQPAVGHGALLLGLGVNLAAAPPANIAPYPTTSIRQHAPQTCPSREQLASAWLWGIEHGLRRFLRQNPRSFEQDFLFYLRQWAPYGVRDPRGGHQGQLLEFSSAKGLRWGMEPDASFHPLGWIPSLEALAP